MKMISVCSSAMNAVGYDKETRRLVIEFVQGKNYDFHNVPQHVYDGLMNSSSKGSYYNNHIRNIYD